MKQLLSELKWLEFLSCFPCAQWNAFENDIRTAIDNQQMDVIGGDCIGGYSKAKALFGLEEPGKSAPSVLGEFQKVATVDNVSRLPRDMMSVCSLHFLDVHFYRKKRSSKPINRVFLAPYYCYFKW